jgi:hypothetical protein
MDLLCTPRSTTLSSLVVRDTSFWQATASEVFCAEQHVLLTGRLDATHYLRSFLHVSIVRDEQGWFIVSDPIFLQWGEGRTMEEALSDYRSTLAEYYDLVHSGAETCAADDAELQRLRQYIEA